MENANILLEAGKGLMGRIFTIQHMTDINEKDREVLISLLSSNEALFSVLPSEKRHELSHKQNDIIIACRFHSMMLCDDAFKLLLSPTFINCYTYVGSETKPYPVGVENGLSLILKEDELSWNKFYTDASNIQNTKGLRISIHEPYTIPNLIDDSIELVPGYSTTIALQQKNMERINTPKSNCMSESWIDNNFRSTTFSCLLQCEVDYIWRRCGCWSEIKPQMYPFKAEENNLQCTFYNESDINSLQEMPLKFRCELNGMEELNTIKEAGTHPPCIAECNWECNSIEYATDVTHSRWPVNEEVPSFLDQYVDEKSNKFNKDYRAILHYKYNGSFGEHYKNEDTFTFNKAVEMSREILTSANPAEIENEWITKSKTKTIIPSISSQHLNLSSIEEAEIKWVQDSFSRLNIYIKEPVVEVHKQVLDYSPADFGSALGGILGLWAGISIITVIELFEFLCGLIGVMLEKAGSSDRSLAKKVRPVQEKN